MTDTIRVTRLGKSLEFEDREALAAHVETFVGHGIYGPLELACLQRLAALGNGDTPPDVKRIARNTAHVTSEGGRAERERAESPFGERIETLDAERQEKAAELDEARAALQATRRELRALDRRKTREELSRAERRQVEDEIRRLRRQLHAQNDAVQDARKAAIRAKAAWNKAKLAADRWRADQDARFVVGDPDDRRVVDREGLMDWLNRR